MWTVCIAGDSHEMAKSYFLWKIIIMKKKKKKKKNRMSSATIKSYETRWLKLSKIEMTHIRVTYPGKSVKTCIHL